MKRWGMLEEGEMPEPNVNIRLAIQWLDKYSDDMSLSILGPVIPLLEVALAGALLKFLLEEVHDPVLPQGFEKIHNARGRNVAEGRGEVRGGVSPTMSAPWATRVRLTTMAKKS